MFRACALFFVVAVCQAAEQSGNSVAPAPDPSTVSESIVVTATRSERTVSDLPVSVSVVREDEIRKAAERSVDDLLRAIPGVTPSIVSSSGSTPNNQRFSMHGLGGTRALVLLDGIPIHDPYSGIVQWQNVALDTLKQIEVVRGGNASLFGNFALGGTVNLIARPVERDDVNLDLSYGTGATGRGALTVDYVVNPTISVRVSEHQLHSNGFVRVPNPGPIDIPAWTDNSVTAGRLEVAPSDRTSGFFNASTAQIDFSQGTVPTFSKRDISAFSAGIHHALGGSAIITGRAYYQGQKEHLVNSTVVGARVSEFVSQDGVIPSSGKGASAEWSMQRRGPIAFVSLGIDVQQLEATEDRVGFTRTGTKTPREFVGGRQRFAGIFGQASWRPTDRVEVLASARLDSFRNENGVDAITGGAVTNYPASSSRQIDPRVSVRYALGSTSALRASVYRAFNAPTLRDLYRNTQSGNSTILGNPYLQSETLVGGEVGGEWTTQNMRLEMNVFRSTIDGLQSRINVKGSPNVFLNMNLGTSRSQGVELFGDVRLAPRWSMNAAYSFVNAVVTSDPDATIVGNLIAEVPKHTGSVAVRYRGAKGTSGELRGLIVSRTYGDTANLAISPAHRVVDFSIAQPLRGSIDIYALVENLFDEKYYQALAVNSFRSGLPRTVTAGIRMNGRPWGRH